MLEQIRANERTKLVCVAVMTDYPDELDLVRLGKLSIERIVAKPTAFDRLVEETRELLSLL